MNRRKLVSVWLFTLAALSLSSTTHFVKAGQRTRLAVVVAKDSGVNELSTAELRRLFRGDAVDAGGKKLVPINRGASSDERLGFDRVVLGMSPQDTSRYWIDRKIRGQNGAPKAVEPADVHVRVVAKLDGAIGYVRLNEVRDDVKVLRIDGKAPTEGGYPLEF